MEEETDRRTFDVVKAFLSISSLSRLTLFGGNTFNYQRQKQQKR
jgi:hypothetical protein